MSSTRVFILGVAGLLLLGVALSPAEGAVAQAVAQIDQPFNITLAKGTLVAKRVTPAHADPQYLFAVGCQQRWTTNGENRVGSPATLSWAGALAFEKFVADDVGTYEFPMEQPTISCNEGGCSTVAATVLSITTVTTAE